MPEKSSLGKRAAHIALSLCLAALLTGCVLPSFMNIGKIALQVISPLVLAAVVALLSLVFKDGIGRMAPAMNLFLAGMVGAAVVDQALLQIARNKSLSSGSGFIYMFYYDKPLTVALVWLSVAFVYTATVIISLKKGSPGLMPGFDRFLNIAGRGFLVYYAIFLFYSFVLIRPAGSHITAANFVPFRIIAEYFKYRSYENFMVFWGNLYIFAPIGLFARVIKPSVKTVFLLLFCIGLSSAVELSQLLFKNGHCDIDDVIINTAGFCLGLLFVAVANKAVKKLSKGRENTVFHWQPLATVSGKPIKMR